jgi:hypothetical protein
MERPGQNLNQPQTLTAHLSRQRLYLRLLLLTDSLLRIIPIACAAFAVAALLDWWVRFPAELRTIFSIAAAVTLIRWVYQRIWRPAVLPIPLDQLAIRLMKTQPQLRDELAGAATYLQQGGTGSKALWQDMIAHAGGDVSTHLLDARINRRGLLNRAIVAAAIVGVLAAIHSNAPAYLDIGVRRFASPFASTNWPKRNLIEPLTRSCIVPQGDPLTVAMRLRRGDDSDFRAYVAWHADDSPEQIALMRRDADGVYRFTIDHVRSPLKYHFIAGDDDTATRPFRVKIALRPAIGSAVATVRPPSYVQHGANRATSLTEDEISVIELSTVHVEITTNKPLGPPDDLRASARLIQNEQQGPLFYSVASGPNVYAVDLLAEKSADYRIRLTDGDGLQSAGDLPFRIVAKPDEPPSVAIVQPAQSLEVTPESTIDFAVSARDDLGIESISLFIVAPDRQPELIPPLTRPPAEKRPPTPDSDERRAYSLNIAQHSVHSGDVIRCFAEAQDAFEADGKRRGPVRSNELVMRVISAAEMADRLQQKLIANRQKLYKIMADLAAIQDRTRLLTKADAALSAAERFKAAAFELAADLAMIINSLRESARGFAEVAKLADANAVKQANIAEQARKARDLLDHEAASTLASAAAAILRAASASAQATRRDDVESAVNSQQSALEALQLMAKELEASGEYHDLIARLQELLDRQEAISRESQSAARAANGQAVSELESLLKQRLLSSAFAQTRLRDDASLCLESMKSPSKIVGLAGRATRQSIDAALILANEQALITSMEQAAQSIRDSRLTDLSSHQSAVASCLRAMIAALNERPQRELAELSRMLQDLTARLAKIIEVQKSLTERTRETQTDQPGTDAAAMLADRQLSVAKTTSTLHGELALDEPLARKAAEELGSADQRMRRAEELIRRITLTEASPLQLEALSSLEKALVFLQRLDDSAQQRLARHSLEVLLQGLRELKSRQLVVRGETKRLSEKSHNKKKVSKADGLTYNRLASQQKSLVGPLDELRKKMEASIIYAHVCDRLARLMNTAATDLTSRDAPGALKQQDEVLRQLARLIESAESTPNEDKRDFVDAQGGGGSGASSPTMDKPIPTLAELRMLKGLQTDLSDQTANLNRELPEPIMRTESQLKQIESLGTEQKQIQALAVKMLQTAADGGKP